MLRFCGLAAVQGALLDLLLRFGRGCCMRADFFSAGSNFSLVVSKNNHLSFFFFLERENFSFIGSLFFWIYLFDKLNVYKQSFVSDDT